MDVVEVVEEDLPRTVPRTDLREEDGPRSKIKAMISPLVSTRGTAICRSAAPHRRAPPRKTRRKREASRQKNKYKLSPRIPTPGTAIRQRSAVQRRTPPRKLERENPSEFRSRLESKPGSKSGATSN